MRRRVLLSSGLAAVLLCGFAGTRVAVSMARPALGFVAKVMCSDIFVGGVSAEQARGDLPDEPVARLVRARVDTGAQSVVAAIPLVESRRAVYRQGAGCTLEPVADLRPVSAAGALDDNALWPDGERTAAHSAAGGQRLAAVVASAFAEADPATPRRTRAVVIVRDGRIIAERYAAGYGPATRFTGWSMTKSVTNALAGILVGRGQLDVSATHLRPEWAGDPRADISLHHLLTMSSGLAFDESYTPGGGATRMLFDAPDAAAVAAASPLVHEPGTHWSYSSATTNIISAVIRDTFASDYDYAAFPRRALFDRVGMRSAVLEPDPGGTFVGSSFMYATARDWARFGLLYLCDGVWNGERILPEGWVQYSSTPATAAPRGRYGAQWWLNAGEPGDTARRFWPRLPRSIFWASGFHGQYLAVVPSHDLVVVRLGVTADEGAFDMGEFLQGIIAALDAPVMD